MKPHSSIRKFPSERLTICCNMLSCSAIVLCPKVFRLQRITSGKPRSSDSSQSSMRHTSTRTELLRTAIISSQVYNTQSVS